MVLTATLWAIEPMTTLGFEGEENPFEKPSWSQLPWTESKGQTSSFGWTGIENKLSGIYWNEQNWIEPFIKTNVIRIVPTGGETFIAIWACLNTVTQSGYRLRISPHSETLSTWKLERCDNKVYTVLAETERSPAAFVTVTPELRVKAGSVQEKMVMNRSSRWRILPTRPVVWV